MRKSLFVNNFSQYLPKFLEDKAKIVRLNSFGRDEDIWYVVPVDSAVFLVAVRKII